MAGKTITDLEGVYANGVHAGIKKDKKDLAFIYVPDCTASAGVFTKNKCAAPSVRLTQKNIKNTTLKAVIINAGNANAYTGEQGARDTKAMVSETAKALGVSNSEVGVASTGVIGVPLPMDKLSAGLKDLLKNPHAKEGSAAAEAILTVDLVTKELFKSKKIGGKEVSVAGISKGSGMIAPNMATTLTYLVTDAALSPGKLQKALAEAINYSLNMVSIDTDTSTNDMVLLLSTGKKVLSGKEERDQFQELLTESCIDIAKQISRDGEGAKKLFEVQISGASSNRDARVIAKNVVSSPLVKTAVAASSPNWGRLVMAIGKDELAKVNEDKIDISIGEVSLVENGVPMEGVRDRAESEMRGDTVIVKINLNLGRFEAKAWGCDMTEEFIRINAEYN